MTAFTDLLANNFVQKTYLVEITNRNVTTDTLETLYYSSGGINGEGGYVSEPFASDPNRFYEGRIADDQFSLLERAAHQFGRTSGNTQIGFGELVLNNLDGGLDQFIDRAFNGHPIVIRLGGVGLTFDEFGVIFTGVIEQVIFDFDNVKVVFKDNLFKLDFPIQLTRFAGTNSGSTGNEGLPDDIAGRPKPLCFGKCLNITPVPVNTSALRYQFHADGVVQAVDAVYDEGVLLTLTTDYAVDLTNGIIDLVATPAGQVTADVRGDATDSGYIDSVSDIVNRILTNKTDLTLDSASFTQLNTDDGSTVGIYIDGNQETKIVDAVDELLTSIGAAGSTGRDGDYKVFALKAPSGTAVETFTTDQILDIKLIRSPDQDKGIPAFRLSFNYAKNYTVQDRGSLASGVTEARVAELSREFRTEEVTDNTVKDDYLNSPVIVRNSLMTESSEAATTASRIHGLFKVKRKFFQLQVKTKALTLDINDVITIDIDRFGLSGGQDFRILKIREDIRNSVADLLVWG